MDQVKGCTCIFGAFSRFVNIGIFFQPSMPCHFEVEGRVEGIVKGVVEEEAVVLCERIGGRWVCFVTVCLHT